LLLVLFVHLDKVASVTVKSFKDNGSFTLATVILSLVKHSPEGAMEI